MQKNSTIDAISKQSDCDKISSTHKPFFSIIIPIYNVDKYLNKCLKSIQEQTYGNFEVICVNDGSTDNSGMILDKIDDPRFVIIHKNNGGTSSARNVGLDRATGKYIFFCDPDDSMTRDALLILKNAIELYPEADWIRGNNFVSSVDGSQKKENLHIKRAPYANKYLSQEEWFDHIVNAGELWATVFFKEKIDRLNLRFNNILRWGEDGPFLVDYTMTGKGVYIPEEVYDYLFMRPDGLSFKRISKEYDCENVVELVREWQERFGRFNENDRMGVICKAFLNKKFINGIGQLSFVPRKWRLKYIRQLKKLIPRADSHNTNTKSLREKIKVWMYNNCTLIFLLPSSK